MMEVPDTGTERTGRTLFALRRFVYPPPERCEICRTRLSGGHAHLLELANEELRCVCGACVDRHPSSEFRAVRPMKEPLSGFDMPEALWSTFQIPVDLAFFVRGDKSVSARFPSPAGLTRSEIDEQAFEDLERLNPAVTTFEPHVDALLINRIGGKRQAWRISIDHCYALAGTIRKSWRGLSGGTEVWTIIGDYFSEAGDG